MIFIVWNDPFFAVYKLLDEVDRCIAPSWSANSNSLGGYS
jgi:hypothetical protein